MYFTAIKKIPISSSFTNYALIVTLKKTLKKYSPRHLKIKAPELCAGAFTMHIKIRIPKKPQDMRHSQNTFSANR
jgi:hypothetical protein